MQVFETGEMKGMGRGGVTEEQIDSIDGPGTAEMDKSLSDAGIYILSFMRVSPSSPLTVCKGGRARTKTQYWSHTSPISLSLNLSSLSLARSN